MIIKSPYQFKEIIKSANELFQDLATAGVEYSDNKKKRWLRRAMSHCTGCDRAREYTLAFEKSEAHKFVDVVELVKMAIGTQTKLFCNHCRRSGHSTDRCSYASEPHQQFNREQNRNPNATQTTSTTSNTSFAQRSKRF